MVKPLELKEIITTAKDIEDAIVKLVDQRVKMDPPGKYTMDDLTKVFIPKLKDNIDGLVQKLDDDYRERKNKVLKELPISCWAE